MGGYACASARALREVSARRALCERRKSSYQGHFLVALFVVAGPPSLPEPSSLKKASSMRASLQPIIEKFKVRKKNWKFFQKFRI